MKSLSECAQKQKKSQQRVPAARHERRFKREDRVACQTLWRVQEKLKLDSVIGTV